MLEYLLQSAPLHSLNNHWGNIPESLHYRITGDFFQQVILIWLNSFYQTASEKSLTIKITILHASKDISKYQEVTYYQLSFIKWFLMN